MAERRPALTLYAGPSAHGLAPARLQRGGVDRRGPVRRGDIAAQVATQAPGVLVICDGVFQAEPAVSHAEIVAALDAGWQVWGVSSLGAIRAHELRREGMRGHGWVHAQFARRADFRDDELALLHLGEPPYLPLTEALVNLRYALARRGDALGIPARAQRRLVAALRELWFGARSVEKMHEIMVGAAAIEAAPARRLLAWMAAHRIKTIDLDALLRERPWAR
ncbi:MAG: hypothetical protein KGJ30_10370 [Burkholderiales bacterium]|nr:hypothetical protein [Burkholderiales bacterium]MDE2159314.1 hypothetical protein [Burkholderiales bacterium]